MFWGELFVFLDIRIGGFDVFPDVIGLILIVAGVHQLAAYQEHFDSLRGIVILRMILSLGDIVFGRPAGSPAQLYASFEFVARRRRSGAFSVILLSYPDGDQGTGKRHFAGTGCLRADAMDADSCLQLRWVPVFLFDAAFQNV